MKPTKRDRIYSAIHEQIMQARIQIARQPGIQNTKPGESIDFRLAQLVGPIFHDVMAIVEPVKELKRPKRGSEA